MERDWRPSEAAERKRNQERAAPSHKDVLFTSQEAIDFDRGVTQSMDPANRTWVPHEPHVPEYDLTSRSEEPKPEHFQ